MKSLILTDNSNTPLSEGIVPDDWKNAYVTPVYKKRSEVQTGKLPSDLFKISKKAKIGNQYNQVPHLLT